MQLAYSINCYYIILLPWHLSKQQSQLFQKYSSLEVQMVFVDFSLDDFVDLYVVVLINHSCQLYCRL